MGLPGLLRMAAVIPAAAAGFALQPAYAPEFYRLAEYIRCAPDRPGNQTLNHYPARSRCIRLPGRDRVCRVNINPARPGYM